MPSFHFGDNINLVLGTSSWIILPEKSNPQKSQRPLRKKLGDSLIAAGHINPEQLQRALETQAASGGRLGDILQAQARLRPLDYYQTLAKHFNLPFLELTKTRVREGCRDKADRSLYARRLLIPVTVLEGRFTIATADPSPAMFEFIKLKWGANTDIKVTSKFDIFWTLQETFNEDYTHEILNELYTKNPQMSARQAFSKNQRIILFGILITLIGMFFINPTVAAIFINSFMTFATTIVLIFKVVLSVSGLLVPAKQRGLPIELDEKTLPLYTILVPLYRESKITLTHLTTHLQTINYPSDLLDIKIIVEGDDHETIDIIKSLTLPSFFEIVRVPPGEPKTKPKACNYALKFARGEYVTIYDAEDKPDPDQLKLALLTYRNANDDLACVQCELNFYNARENWLTRMFTMEYTFWFDLVLPAMNKFKFPIPLGGTSNHFRLNTMEEMLAWDPYNVTEDADLGIRIYRLGNKTAVIPSTTWEEATSRIVPWIKQRTRWIKGYKQTYLIHLRNPSKLYREFGFMKLLSFHLFVGGNVFTHLVNLLLFFIFLTSITLGFERTRLLFPPLVLEFALFNLIVGNLLLLLLHVMAISKREMKGMAILILTVPIYWLLHSLASYRALYQLFVKPHYWDKTDHDVRRYLQSDDKSDHVGN